MERIRRGSVLQGPMERQLSKRICGPFAMTIFISTYSFILVIVLNYKTIGVKVVRVSVID